MSGTALASHSGSSANAGRNNGGKPPARTGDGGWGPFNDFDGPGSGDNGDMGSHDANHRGNSCECDSASPRGTPARPMSFGELIADVWAGTPHARFFGILAVATLIVYAAFCCGCAHRREVYREMRPVPKQKGPGTQLMPPAPDPTHKT